MAITTRPLRDRLVGTLPRRRGIEPLVATIILVAIAMAIALAFASWIFGFWNVHSTIHGQAIDVFGDSYYDSATRTLYIHLKVHIDPSVTLHFEVKSLNITSVSVYKVVSGSAVASDGKVYATVGSEFWVAIKTNKSVPPGTTVYFKIYTEKGYVFWSDAVSR